jgi:phosphoglycolate phosphatase-like HAD superfamily hydrolase
VFNPIVTQDDVANPKPAPDGLELVKKRYPGKSIWYLGDTVDDARAAQAAGVPFVGVASKDSPRYRELVAVLKHNGAFTVLSDVNELLNLIAEPEPAL